MSVMWMAFGLLLLQERGRLEVEVRVRIGWAFLLIVAAGLRGFLLETSGSVLLSSAGALRFSDVVPVVLAAAGIGVT